MTSKTKVTLLVLIIALGFVIYLSRNVVIVSPIQTGNTVPVTETPAAPMSASFAWETEPSDALNLDGQPKTNVFVKATYENGVTERKLVDVESGCGVLPQAEKDGAVYQCYAAGAGAKYKVIEVNGAYLVQRKRFEEALPNVTPTKYEYETIAQFTSVK